MDIMISSNFERLLFDKIGDASVVANLMHELKNTGSYQLDDQVVRDIKEDFCSFSVSLSLSLTTGMACCSVGI